MPTNDATMRRVSTDGAGNQADGGSYDPVFSPAGTRLAFRSAAGDLVPGDDNGTDDVFVVDLAQGGAGDDVLAPLAPGEPVFGHAGDDRFLGSPFGDVCRPGTGADVARLGAGVDRVIGTAAELDGDRTDDLATEDAILVEGVRFDLRHVEVELGSAVLRIDSDRNGTIDTTITLDGDFSAGRFLVLPSTGRPATTTIR